MGNNDAKVDTDAQNESSPAVPTRAPLRIACLEPSATAICLELGLGDSIVGVTHECEPILAHVLDSGNADPAAKRRHPLVLTKSGLTVTSQADIHLAVQQTAAAAAALASQAACPIRKKNDEENILPLPSSTEIPSTYPLIEERLQAARPTVIFTQDLCDVCAPTTADVRRCLMNGSDDGESKRIVSVVSLQPTTLHEVTDTFVTIAEACGIPERGRKMRDDFLSNLEALRTAIQENRKHGKDPSTMPTLFILEWLDPVFDSGHWTYQMMEYACVQSARPKKQTHKATVIEWEDVSVADPDVIVVGCCGFDLERNIRDTLAKKEQLQKLRAGRNQRIYASYGDWYIAQPAPFLLQGVALLAQCAYQNEPRVLDAIAELGFETIGWEAVDVMSKEPSPSETKEKAQTKQPEVKDCVLGDMEDIVPDQDHPGFAKLHDLACAQGEMSYTDPETEYEVFTRLAHEKRGKCCGSGCRHCPYSHANVKDKAAKIQQPSILYQQSSNESEGNTSRIFSTRHNKNVKVLFFSGGKDSFLAIRALARSHSENGPFGLILMTTFDAATRVIAHQEIGIDQVIRQASHLDITLVGIPLRRASGETYTDRIRAGLKAIRSFLSPQSRVSALVFGDLHLSHVKEWRDKILTQLDCELEYPLWKRTYSDLLDDLKASTVPCQVSGSTREEIPVGTMFDTKLYDRLVNTGIDGFGECGEFHSLAMVWEVPRSTALGLNPE
eukprot:jgi/Psemu1/190979/e_gw1.108.65.1